MKEYGDITDCHVHVVDPNFEMVPVRSYTPQPRTAEDLRLMMKTCSIRRVVVVQISVYGNDNSALLSALESLGSSARGIIHLRGDETGQELENLHRAGVRGVRVNMFSNSETEPEAVRLKFAHAVQVCQRMNWHIQTFILPHLIAPLEGLLAGLPVPLVIDHFGILSARNRGSEAEEAMLRLRRTGNVWLKLSSPYRLEGSEDEELVGALARDLVAISPETVIWGSDWPHPPKHAGQPQENPPSRPYREIETAKLLPRLEDWFRDEGTTRAILVDNPARLFGFA